MGMAVGQFVEHWKGASGGERAQSQSFLVGLCQALGLDAPKDGDYKFEYAVPGDRGTDFIDLYKRGSFVLEAKQSRAKGQRKAVEGQSDLFHVDGQSTKKGVTGRALDVLMLNARQQAEGYARHLPSSHEWPPFIIVCDVGNCFELYADFSGKGRNYTQFPDRQGFRVGIEDFRKPEALDLFRAIWNDPHSLDPTKRAAKATREIAERLAAVSKRLEAQNHPPEEVALFLMRCLFTMFAEDTELIPKGSFTALLDRCIDKPDAFMPMVGELWKQMNSGGFAIAIETMVRKFNGKLFSDARVFPMGREDIGELKEAAAKDWREVDPSIFGTLLEQALDPKERSRLGAHYTPRAYVERLVLATIVEPLREEWNHVQGALEIAPDKALEFVKEFHRKLCETRVLDPACGTGNFLYVTMELMKRLEGEVLDTIERLGGQEALRLEKFSVDPHQFLGIEINPRAAAIAELVLWIGYLRWHLRTKGEPPPEPILREFKNIERRDAVLEYDGIDAKGNFKNPRRPQWPEADYIVGNPPFIGGKDIRSEIGDAKVETLWAAHPEINNSADFVMYWWDRAAELLTRKATRLKRFGLVTTNSITQVFQRRTVERHLKAKSPVSLLMAIPDHPWTKATKDAAAVRIAMTVATSGSHDGVLREVISENALDTDEPVIVFRESKGRINSDLTVGTDVTQATPLLAGEGLCSPGVKLHGSGFIVAPAEAHHLGLGRREGLGKHIRLYRNGRDLTGTPRGVFVIDLFGLEPDEVRTRFPEVYQHIVQTVKVERDANNRESYKRLWWVFGEPRKDLRPALAGLSRYIATVETAKHRMFQFLDAEILPDNRLVVIASSDALHLGVLSSHIHVVWALATGGTLEDRPIYTKSQGFDPFPFPQANPLARAQIADLGERLDRHRKDAQAAHPDITLTQMYNVLEKVRAAQALTDADRTIFDDALILILKELHDGLDCAVTVAYGWPSDLSEEDILARLVALNKQRAAEEAKGQVRWLRPEYQIPRFGTPAEKAEQLEADLGIASLAKVKPSFPSKPVEQTAAVMAMLALEVQPVSAGDMARGFKQGRKAEARVLATLSSLARTGFISAYDGGRRFAIRSAA